ncbi:NADH-quinone oxidoreductase subunit L [Urbifossiella limnaea]|uniref:NADH-quinone oxidoreductase subunit L n=1 Tax=Urbifossiella limnaea TaxID=2528023 RepID=A0A517XZM9_9BACT|nr:NADH-quinone oxidoreductase subunit L [Urbifossiella limnaea]QDU22943.1 NADH-quinone oxidoreductase subunit L [Urbifossiella limnaea]
MPEWFDTSPGRLYVVATLLPLLGCALLLLGGLARALCRPHRERGGAAGSLYWLLGGDRPLTTGAYLATALMGCATVLAVVGLVTFLGDVKKELKPAEMAARWSGRVDWIRVGNTDPGTPAEWDRSDSARLVRDGSDAAPPVPQAGRALELGYRIDHLTALMVAMVAVIGTLIFVFSLGYMRDETKPTVEDHEVDHQTPGSHHYARRGRYGRFFAYLSLFAFSMLNLLIADNLFQVFVSWELVGVCSFFLIGFYYERPSASRAAAKAFIVNRVGDAGFLVGIFVAWTSLGTLNIEELTRRVRSPDRDSHGSLPLARQLVRANPDGVDKATGHPQYAVVPPGEGGSHLALFPLLWEDPTHFHGLGFKTPGGSRRHEKGDPEFVTPPEQRLFDFGAMPYWLFVVMGAGIFLGCVGKSAQVPLHTWLPDAMEGPTPVSALIHAATMVAAGVYLVGRCYVLFAPEVLLGVAYTGAVTLFVAATIALVQTDIKRVLAYSTCSQLGYMMLALGVGGWAAGLLHLLTHAFFKALLFLGSGSVIHGCHHEQDLRKMGGLLTKMRITGFTMLVGVLAIAGAPLFSGWYSKDQILSSALGYGLEHRQHMALFVLPLVTAAMTGFYMFRLWFLAFTGAPRDQHVHDHAHESPPVMTVPLVVLAVFSVGVAWGWPIWDADASALGRLLEAGRPAAWLTMFGVEAQAAHENHLTAGALALLAAVLGAGLAAAMYWRPKLSPAAVRARAGGVYPFLLNKWYFDEAYDAALVKPAVGLAFASAAADKRPTDGETDAVPPRRYDVFTLDGLITTAGQLVGAAGSSLRRVQTGRLRGYVLVLALTVVGLLGMLLSLT